MRPNAHVVVVGLLLLFPWAILLFIGLMSFLHGFRTTPRPVQKGVGRNPPPMTAPPLTKAASVEALKEWVKQVLERRDEG